MSESEGLAVLQEYLDEHNLGVFHRGSGEHVNHPAGRMDLTVLPSTVIYKLASEAMWVAKANAEGHPNATSLGGDTNARVHWAIVNLSQVQAEQE